MTERGAGVVSQVPLDSDLVVFLTSYQVNNAPCGHDNRVKNKRVAHFRISVALLLTRWLLVLSLELRIPLSSDNWIDLISPLISDILLSASYVLLRIFLEIYTLAWRC